MFAETIERPVSVGGTEENQMNPHDVCPGLKFRDNGLSQPPEYRVHVVVDDDTDTFKACHLASGNIRTFERTRDACAKLEPVGKRPVGTVNLDCLTGERVRIDLVMGSSISGMVTAVRYGEAEVDGRVIKFVREIELDKSGGSSYPLHECIGVHLVSR